MPTRYVDVLGGNFIGLYPTGSLAIGDFDLRSDVDFVVITAAGLSDREVQQIQSAHSDLVRRESRWVRHLEHSFFTLAELRTKSSPYGSGGRRVESADRQRRRRPRSGRAHAAIEPSLSLRSCRTSPVAVSKTHLQRARIPDAA